MGAMKPYTWRSAIVKSNLPSTTRFVLLTLSLYINDVGQSAYPSIERLAKETGLTDRAVGKHLRLAKELGWVRVGKMGFGGQNWANNCYFPQIPGDAQYAEQAIEGQERGSAPFSKGQEPRSGKVRNDVQTNNPVELSIDKTTDSLRASRLKKDWFLPKHWGEWALQNDESWTADHVRLQAEKFRDYWIGVPGKAGTKLDWEATWRNWCRNAGSRPAAGKASGGAWWASEESKLAKAAEVGVGPAVAGESTAAWEARIRAAIDNGGKPPGVTRSAQAVTIRDPGAVSAKAVISDENRAALRAATLALKRITSTSMAGIPA